jgi:hypothetical protein
MKSALASIINADDDTMRCFYYSHLARSSQEGAKKVKMKDMRGLVEESWQIMHINIKNIIRYKHINFLQSITTIIKYHGAHQR